MKPIFNYQTLEVNLAKETKTLFIKLKNDQLENAITMETLFELESLLSWLTTRVEIRSVFINSNTQKFSRGYNKNILKNLTIDKLSKFTKKLQKINQALMYLPQTVIVDLQKGVNNVASELATACDIRLAHRACEVAFDHAKIGIIACSGGIAQLSKIVGHANARNWLLSGKKIKINQLENSGYVFESYTEQNQQEKIQELLMSIYDQAPVQRIQTKLGVVENIRMHVDEMTKFENQIAQASMIAQDWRSENAEEPMPAKSMGVAVKLSLVKDHDDNNKPPIN